MYKQLKNEKGFTIIEVMIVLAIAGLILLIVFLAVPALQRNSRNTQRKSDVGRVGSAIQTVIANNNGTLPAPALATTSIQTELGTLSYYINANITVIGAAAAGAGVNNATVDQVQIYTDATCVSKGAAGGLGASSTG